MHTVTPSVIFTQGKQHYMVSEVKGVKYTNKYWQHKKQNKDMANADAIKQATT